MKCANCSKDAMYEYKVSKLNSIFYCGKDLPSFLNERKKAGLLTITEEYKEASVSALEALESVKEDVTEEANTTKKKATTKKSEK
jgi:hypothetical protein